MFLDWAGLAVSFFITISLIWLGLMVLLNGNRRTGGTWIIAGGLLGGALFFVSHTAILGRGLADISFGMDFWYWVSWAPAIAAPLAWYGALLWYAGFNIRKPHPHRKWLAIVAGLALITAGLAIFANPLPSYKFIVGSLRAGTPTVIGLPVLVVAYVVYSLICYLLPLDLLRRENASRQPLAAAARKLARPWLAGASLSFLLAAGVLTWTALWALESSPRPSLRNAIDVTTVKQFDLAVQVLIAIAITLLGRAVVAYEVFTGRPLPRLGFFRHWRSTVLVAGGYGALAAWMLVIQLRSLYSLMLATALMTFFYALYSWRSFAERERFMARLRPFIASQNLYEQLIDTNPPESGAPQEFFETFCRDVLGVRAAALVPAGALSTLAGPPLVYTPDKAPLGVPAAVDLAGLFPSPGVICRPSKLSRTAWAVSLWNERNLAGVLLLGDKIDGNPYTDEEMEIAQAGGERLLDMLAGAEMARLAMNLLRQRLAQVQVMEGQGRRVLHDEVLPALHTAILYLSSKQDVPEVRQSVDMLADTHRRISDLMTATPAAATHRLAQNGLVVALEELVEADFSREFDAVDWRVEPEAAAEAGRLPLFASEVVYFAVRELLRNAARHGRGGAAHQALRLAISLELHQGLQLIVEDDGVGFSLQGQAGGAGSGLRFHSAMLAVVGASLEVGSPAGCGTRAVIYFPLDSIAPAGQI